MPTSYQATDVSRNAGLDLLRLIAVVLVLGRHLLPADHGNKYLNVLQTGGWVGVDMFFVLSGFLVSGLLFQEYKKTGGVDIKRFIIRRGFKIYPPLFLLIAVTVFFASCQGQPLKIRQTLSELMLMQNYAGALWNHTWSLAVEWHFYLLLSLLLVLLLKWRKSSATPLDLLPIAFLFCAVFCLAARIVTSLVVTSSGPENHKWLYYGSHIRLDALMFGVLIGFLWHFRDLKAKTADISTIFLLLLGCALMTPAFFFSLEQDWFVSVFGFTLFYFASGFLLLAAVRFERADNSLTGLLVALGSASYSIYLWHMAVNWWLWPWISTSTGLSIEENYGAYIVVFVGASLFLGYYLNKLVEKPSLRLREKLFPRANSSSLGSRQATGQQNA